MEKITRTEQPQWLAEKWQQWGVDWEKKVNQSGSSSFSWRQNKKQGKADLVKRLSAMTLHHCSFCDAHPMGSRLQSTIEHFRPKSLFPRLAYQWQNLFLCCRLCQDKGDEFDEALLKPDDESYHFDDYFDIEWDTGKLVPSPAATTEQRHRARCTIVLYRLNDHGKPNDRLQELEKYQDANNPDINQLAYRFFLQRGRLDEGRA